MILLKCDVCNKQCMMEYYENHSKSKTKPKKFDKLKKVWQFFDICKNDINKSSWKKHMNKHAGLANTKLYC